MVDEEALFSSNRSFEDWQEEMRSTNTDSIEVDENDFKFEDFAKISSEHFKSEILIPPTKCQSVENNKKHPTTSVENNSSTKFDLKCDKNNRKNRAILKILSQKIDGTQE